MAKKISFGRGKLPPTQSIFHAFGCGENGKLNMPRLVVGLGNPHMDGTRHNFGFHWVEHVANSSGEKFKFFPRLFADLCFLNDEKQTVLMRPKSFINLSGAPVKRVMSHLNIKEHREILVVHDCVETPVGKYGIRRGGSARGHNGVKSIQKYLDSQDFLRFKIGIGRPKDPVDLVEYVLSNPTNDEFINIDENVCIHVTNEFLKELGLFTPPPPTTKLINHENGSINTLNCDKTLRDLKLEKHKVKILGHEEMVLCSENNEEFNKNDQTI